MRIDFDRICKLAGVDNNTSNQLNEAGNRSYHEDSGLNTERDLQHGRGQLNEEDQAEGHYMEEEDQEEGHHMEEEDQEEGHYMEGEDQEEGYYMEEDAHAMEEEDEELVEIDISELMSEIRRAKKMMENKRNNKLQRQQIKENHLKRLIQKEVESVLSEIEERDSSWLYGKRKPKSSKKGYTAQGSHIPGIGFYK